MVLILIFLFAAVVFAWIGKRRNALFFFAMTFGMAVVWFLHNVNTNLLIQL